MSELTPDDFARIYASFDTPITAFDCGKKCGPYNQYGVPFCCDTNHMIPTSFHVEWSYLQYNTNLWHKWVDCEPGNTGHLESATPEDQILVKCLGHKFCQRGFRTITCRSFPFFPYITEEREFIGLSYYSEYEDRCWVISHLEAVQPEYVKDFVKAYDWIFKNITGEIDSFRNHSIIMRRTFGREKRLIPLLHRNGGTYSITPNDGSLEKVDPTIFPMFGPYKVAALMPFPDEL